MQDRIRRLREDKDLSRAAFGKKLGVSGDVINNLERGRVEAKEHMIKLICTEYSVSEEWLRHGKGPMYVQPETFCLDDFVRQHGATDFELDILKIYFELDPNIRRVLANHFRKHLTAENSAKNQNAEPNTPEPAADLPEPNIKKTEEEYKRVS